MGHRVPGQTHYHAVCTVPDSVPCSATTLIPAENCYTQYTALLKIRLPPTPSLVEVYIQKIWRTQDDKWRSCVRAPKSLCTQEGTQARRTEVSQHPICFSVYGSFVSVETKEGLAFAFSHLLATFLLLLKGRYNPVYFQLCDLRLPSQEERLGATIKVNPLNYIFCCFNQIQWWWCWGIRLAHQTVWNRSALLKAASLC